MVVHPLLHKGSKGLYRDVHQGPTNEMLQVPTEKEASITYMYLVLQLTTAFPSAISTG